jgi:MFS family permease
MLTATKERRTLGGAAPLLAATAVSVTGDGAFNAAVPLLAATLTASPLILSTVSAAFQLPGLLFGLHAGALADRWPRRRTMIAADVVHAVVLAAVVALQLTGRLTIAGLAVAVAVIGAGQCFFAAASQSMIPALAGRDKQALTHVNGRYWAIDTAGRNLAGPSLGAAAFTLNRVFPFAADAVSFLASAALLTRLPENTPTRTVRTAVTADIREGLHFLTHHRQLRTMLLIVCGNNSAFSIAFATFVLYARNVLHVPAAGYGALLAMTAVGAVAAGWWAKPLTRNLSSSHALALACAGQCTAWTVIAAVHSPWIAGAAFLLIGATANIATVSMVTMRQALTPDHLLGRVTSVFRLAGAGITALAALAGGALATAYGLHAPLIAAVLLLVAVTAATLAFRRPGSPVHAAL